MGYTALEYADSGRYAIGFLVLPVAAKTVAGGLAIGVELTGERAIILSGDQRDRVATQAGRALPADTVYTPKSRRPGVDSDAGRPWTSTAKPTMAEMMERLNRETTARREGRTGWARPTASIAIAFPSEP